jgi:hypothetical protein
VTWVGPDPFLPSIEERDEVELRADFGGATSEKIWQLFEKSVFSFSLIMFKYVFNMDNLRIGLHSHARDGAKTGLAVSLPDFKHQHCKNTQKVILI